MIKKYLTVIILFNILLFSQEWKPFHIDDLDNHRDYLMNYEETDIKASLIQNHTTRRNLTHNIVGYLPYWEYSIYPTLDYELLTEINFFSAELNQYGDIKCVQSHW